MNIALIRRNFSATGGAEHYTERLASGLSSHGHAITLVCESWHEQTQWFTIKLPTHDPVAFARACSAKRFRERFDLVLSLDRVPDCDLYRAGDGVHAIWMQRREMYAPWVGRFRNWSKPKNAFLCELEREVFDLSRTQHVIANSHMVKREIMNYFGYPENRIDVIHNGVPPPYFNDGDRKRGRKALRLAKEDYVVLLVGSGAERKGVRYAQAAVKSMRHHGKLLVIDSPPPVAMPDVYAAADVFLLPTLYDPFSNATLEALASGLPVITTVHNGASEVIHNGENGFILNRADDVQAMIGLLDRFHDSNERENIQQPAKALAKKFDFDRNLEATLKIAESLGHHRSLTIEDAPRKAGNG